MGKKVELLTEIKNCNHNTLLHPVLLFPFSQGDSVLIKLNVKNITDITFNDLWIQLNMQIFQHNVILKYRKEARGREFLAQHNSSLTQTLKSFKLYSITQVYSSFTKMQKTIVRSYFKWTTIRTTKAPWRQRVRYLALTTFTQTLLTIKLPSVSSFLKCLP